MAACNEPRDSASPYFRPILRSFRPTLRHSRLDDQPPITAGADDVPPRAARRQPAVCSVSSVGFCRRLHRARRADAAPLLGGIRQRGSRSHRAQVSKRRFQPSTMSRLRLPFQTVILRQSAIGVEPRLRELADQFRDGVFREVVAAGGWGAELALHARRRSWPQSSPSRKPVIPERLARSPVRPDRFESSRSAVQKSASAPATPPRSVCRAADLLRQFEIALLQEILSRAPH